MWYFTKRQPKNLRSRKAATSYPNIRAIGSQAFLIFFNDIKRRNGLLMRDLLILN